MTTEEQQLEDYINAAWAALNQVTAVPARRDAWRQLRELIGKRTPDQIDRMEREQGLRR